MTSVRTKKNNPSLAINTLAKLLTEKEFSNTTTPSTTKATMASLLGTTAAEENKCKALILKGQPELTTRKSYFLNFNFLKRKKTREGFTKVRIKIPKLLIKTAKPKKKDDPNLDNAKRPVSKRVASLLSKPFGCKKPEKVKVLSVADFGITNSFGRRSNCSRTDDEIGSQCWEVYSESFRGSAFSLNSGDHPLSSPSSKENMEIVAIKPVVSVTKKADEQNVCPTCKRPLEMEVSSTKNLTTKTVPMKFARGRYGSSSSSSSSSSSISSRSVLSSYGKDGEAKGALKKSSSSKRFLFKNSERKKAEVNGEDEGDKELCKKKILMGERCRPLDDENEF